jgi:predicted RNase H-like HicB family nuclease
MTIAHIVYHQETDGWWAESPEFPSFFAAADTFDDAQERVREALPKVAGGRKYLGLIHVVYNDPPAVVADGFQAKEPRTGYRPKKLALTC